jgi:hypothetical protein
MAEIKAAAREEYDYILGLIISPQKDSEKQKGYILSDCDVIQLCSTKI